MTGFAADKLQVAVYAALAGSDLLRERGVNVYDQPPLEAKKPYICLADTDMQPDHVKGVKRAHTDFMVKIWSDEQSQMETKELMRLVDGLLEGANLPVSGHELKLLHLTNASVVRVWTDENSEYQGRLTYRATTQKL